MDGLKEKLAELKNKLPGGNKTSAATAAPKNLGDVSVDIDFKKILEKLKSILPGAKRPAKSVEINLVPDVKDEMIKALKLRNLIFFICIVVSAASIGVTAIFGSIAGGQQAAVNGKKETLVELSKKVNSYSDLSEFLTIRNQLSNLSSIAENKMLLSRTFGILSALLPHGADTITLSELAINLRESEPTLEFDGQANAGAAPYIDYNVLDAFKKSMKYMRYDYGNYVDKEGAKIPEYCMVESGEDGATFADSTRGYYAFWLVNGEGCNPYAEEEEEEEVETTVSESTDAETVEAEEMSAAEKAIVKLGYTPEEYEGQKVVRIWRTPQFEDWYRANYMDESGTIEGVAHFESQCISYSAYEDDNEKLIWESENESCLLVPNGAEGIVISDSSNGRGASDELVLRFSAEITLAPEVYNFNNAHMLAIAPSGRFNVTDSYVQIQSMFGERAADCADNDAACRGN